MCDFDLIKSLLQDKGQIISGRVDMKPGKPLTVAQVGDKLLFGVSRNPSSFKSP
jgi:molybdopterin biosynthesis enzyme